MVNFTFVTHKGARPEKSELVKSHVMRESQRKRREARQRRQYSIAASGQQPYIATSSLLDEDPSHLGAQSQSALLYRQVPGNTASGDTTVEYRPATEVVDPSLFPSTSCGGYPGLSNIVSAANGAHESWNDIHDNLILHRGQQPSRSWSLSEGVSLELVNLHSAFGQPSDAFLHSNGIGQHQCDPTSVLTQQPRLWYAAFQSENDPTNLSWMSQSLFDRVTELTAHYTSSLYIERPGLPAVNPIHYWQRQALVNSKILLSTALFYCAYRDTVRGMAGDDHHYFKDRILHLINLALENPDTAVSDDNIAAVISMCMYENIRGSDLIVTHLRGLRQMLDMRGGVNNLPSNQGQFLSEMAILQDLMRSTCSNMPPMMFDITGPILRDVRLNSLENWYPQSPLRVLNDASFARPIPELQSSFDTLKGAFDAFEMLCIEAFDADTASEEAELFEIRREKFSQRLKSRDDLSNDKVPSTTRGKVEKAIHIAATIHFRAVVLRIQHNDDANTEDMKRLYAIIRKIELGFWKLAHYVYLWILLTGGAASSKHPMYRPHFMSEILRLGLSIGLFDWRSFRQTLGNFLWLQQFLRRNGMENVTEILEKDV